MKKQAKEFKTGDFVKIANHECIIENIEISNIGKAGKRKVRIEAKTNSGEKIVIIRPEDYPMDSA